MRRVYGDIEESSLLQRLTLRSLPSLPPGTKVIFLGDVITPYNEHFNESRKFLHKLFRALKLKIINKYENIIDAFKNFQKDLIKIISEHDIDAYIYNKNNIPLLDYNIIKRDIKYNPREDLDTEVVFIIGNKEIRVMMNIIKCLYHYIYDNKFIIYVSDSHYHDVNITKDNNVYTLSLKDINLFYTYFHMCRMCFIENNIIYLHKGGNLTPYASMFKVKDTHMHYKLCIAGHDKMIGVIKYKELTTCFFDHSKYEEYFPDSLTENNIYMEINIETNAYTFPHVNYLLRKFDFNVQNAETIEFLHDPKRVKYLKMENVEKKHTIEMRTYYETMTKRLQF